MKDDVYSISYLILSHHFHQQKVWKLKDGTKWKKWQKKLAFKGRLLIG